MIWNYDYTRSTFELYLFSSADPDLESDQDLMIESNFNSHNLMKTHMSVRECKTKSEFSIIWPSSNFKPKLDYGDMVYNDRWNFSTTILFVNINVTVCKYIKLCYDFMTCLGKNPFNSLD